MTTPDEAVSAIEGRIWEGDVDPERLDELREEHLVTQALHFQGRTRTRVFAANGNVPAGFAPAQETLEDAYLVMMHTDGSILPASVPASDVGDEEMALQ